MTVETRRTTPINNLLLVTGTTHPTPPASAGRELVSASAECLLVRTKPAVESGTMLRLADAASLAGLSSVGELRWTGSIDATERRLRVTDILEAVIIEWPHEVVDPVTVRVFSDHPLTPDDLVIVIG